jgi:hemerythrin-like domain-containing protein
MKKSSTAILLGGIAAGAVAGRLLPPLVSALLGSGRVRVGGDPFALLIDDHRQIQSILDQMMAAPADSTARRAGLFLKLKRKLAKHAMAEEDVVYPIVRNESATGNERRHLYDEHAEMKIMLYELEAQLKAGEEWAATVGPLRELIRRHIEEEEGTIFPQLRRQLSASELPQVSGQISREEALIV